MEEEKTIKVSIGKSSGNVKIEYEGFEDGTELYSALYGVANKVKVEHLTKDKNETCG